MSKCDHNDLGIYRRITAWDIIQETNRQRKAQKKKKENIFDIIIRGHPK